MTKLPWLALGLLLLAYTTFSWFLYAAHVTWLAWAAVLMFTLAEALLLTTFSKGVRSLVRSWLASDVGYFTTIICAAFLVVIALVWVRVFSYVVMVLAAELLARLELQQWQKGRWQSFVILSLVSFAGLGLGLGMGYLLRRF
ncbi:MAG: hypothetical protein EA367_02080 [Leptolyngbya sp. DLM2.Bin15]|nr:MAG: hypothetical protein EA367_02080 [Leptolyngbya sp. DLM2.Bin15]